MAGVKQFNPEAALERAMSVFWAKGYPATSIPDLEEATGLSRSSVYATFGTKEELFLKALEEYCRRYAKTSMSALSDGDVRSGMRRMLQMRAERMADPTTPSGCMYLSAAVDQMACPDSIRRVAANAMRGMEDVLYETLRDAQARGDLGREKDPRELARFFVAVSHGMSAMSTVHPDARVLADVIDVAMRSLD